MVEASDRVGGKVRDAVLSIGGSVELGAQWVGHEHNSIRLLAHELGIDLVSVPTGGTHVLVRDGSATPFTGRISEAMATRTALLDAIATLDRLVATVQEDPEALAVLDSQTTQSWLPRTSKTEWHARSVTSYAPSYALNRLR